ncbi:hypothetical protein ABB37_00281 [Leptomonas pyrrhocoris]|uniref:Uncharacterized protein n=1 Tax=Leptomonas pyrrhocoris TaxID=157538 RepID=A0A0N0E036_LEPPY|nr:hypothetical protein ABB37_00281 [Leptomonas pyrrhocoris]KPA85992.1 hypothetical protein ABB37_00281 [Leptomonas pyrrhocoris]|eukprot:XP_015664431.1 hypothetical protein ABB37_00281 [Leptomonas pyrrhocoris]
MEALTLPLAPGSTTAILHPINVFGASWAILRHALSSLNPDTAIVRRVHHPRRTRSHAGAEESRGVDTASVASSRASRRSNASSTAAGGAAADSAAHRQRHHRTHSGEADSTRRHRHRTSSSQESESAADGTAAATTTAASSSSGTRRTRSAEEPRAASRRTAAEGGDQTAEEGKETRVRRSHSDGARGRSSRRGDDNGGSGSGTTTPRLSTSHPLSPAATAAAASGLTPPLAPPPPVPRGLGKPPLSARQRSTTPAGAEGDGAAAPVSSERHRHHRSGSGGGLSSSGRSSRTRRSAADDEESNEGSVIVIRDGAGISLGSVMAGWPSLFAAAGTGSVKSFSWSPRAWWNRLRVVKVTRPAFLIDHVLHAVPVMIVHYCCELKRQLVTLPLLRFSDICVRFSPRDAAHSEAAGRAGAPAATKTSADWPPTEEAFEASPSATIGHLLLTRWMLHAVESYIDKSFFLDETLVVRQLRSKRTLRRVVGWTVRVVSHTVFDPLLLSIVVPLLISSETSAAAASTDAPRVLFTVPGMVRGLGISAASVIIQWLVMPTASRLVDRAVLTSFELVEYLIMRRYAHWSDEDEDEEEDDLDEEDGDDGASIASGVSGASRDVESRSASQQSSASAAAEVATAEDRIRRQRRRLRREKLERRKRREQRQAARERAMRRTVLRAIVYRVVSSVVAQVVVDHPLSVLVELLRGRATLHFTGMLTPYAAMTAAQDGLSWANVWRYAEAFATPVKRAAADREDEGVPRSVVALRRAGRDAAQELVVISSSVLDNSGQQGTLDAVKRRAAAKKARGKVTSAADSAEFLLHSALSLSPFYYGLQFTVIDNVLSFYMAVWTRLTKQ